MSYVFSGKAVPYPDFLIHNRLDYTSRIFRIRLDRNRQRVTKVISTGPVFPISSSVGQFGDMDASEVFQSSSKEITVRLRAQGFEIFDEILIHEFNTIVQMFKVAMRKENRENLMVLIPRSLNYIFQHRAYPRINPDTHVMEWWVDRDLFNQRSLAFLKSLGEEERIRDAIIQVDESDIEIEGG